MLDSEPLVSTSLELIFSDSRIIRLRTASFLGTPAICSHHSSKSSISFGRHHLAKGTLLVLLLIEVHFLTLLTDSVSISRKLAKPTASRTYQRLRFPIRSCYVDACSDCRWLDIAFLKPTSRLSRRSIKNTTVKKFRFMEMGPPFGMPESMGGTSVSKTKDELWLSRGCHSRISTKRYRLHTRSS